MSCDCLVFQFSASSTNRLTAIPSEISQLRLLRTLNVAKNLLTYTRSEMSRRDKPLAWLRGEVKTPPFGNGPCEKITAEAWNGPDRRSAMLPTFSSYLAMSAGSSKRSVFDSCS